MLLLRKGCCLCMMWCHGLQLMMSCLLSNAVIIILSNALWTYNKRYCIQPSAGLCTECLATLQVPVGSTAITNPWHNPHISSYVMDRYFSLAPLWSFVNLARDRNRSVSAHIQEYAIHTIKSSLATASQRSSTSLSSVVSKCLCTNAQQRVLPLLSDLAVKFMQFDMQSGRNRTFQQAYEAGNGHAGLAVMPEEPAALAQSAWMRSNPDQTLAELFARAHSKGNASLAAAGSLKRLCFDSGSGQDLAYGLMQVCFKLVVDSQSASGQEAILWGIMSMNRLARWANPEAVPARQRQLAVVPTSREDPSLSIRCTLHLYVATIIADPLLVTGSDSVFRREAAKHLQVVWRRVRVMAT